ncbi:MAG: potassium uptake protein [uncultured bacterium]|nr:MAG: potassium uptake protein [uncultured bacterium]
MCRRRVAENQRALAKIIQHQGRQNKGKPGADDGFAAEMPHVGIQGLGSGHGEHDIAHRNECQGLVGEQKFNAIERIKRFQNCRMSNHIAHAEHGQRAEPQHHDRAEKSAHRPRAAPLDKKQAKQHQQGERDDKRLERRGCHLQPLNRRKH